MPTTIKRFAFQRPHIIIIFSYYFGVFLKSFQFISVWKTDTTLSCRSELLP